MNRIRRTGVLLGTAAAVLFGSVLPADAQFADSATAATAVTTVDVTAPGDVSTAGTKCTSTVNNGFWTTRLQAKVSWTASASRGVTGYRINAVLTDGTRYPVAEVGAGVSSISGNYDAYYASQNIRVSVTTLTSYGWTEESGLSGAIKC